MKTCEHKKIIIIGKGGGDIVFCQDCRMSRPVGQPAKIEIGEKEFKAMAAKAGLTMAELLRELMTAQKAKINGKT